MKKKANIFLSIALIIALLVLIYCVYEIVSLQDELTFAREKNKIMAQQLQSLSMESKNYREEINNFPGLNDFDIRRLKQQGIEDPEETIINTLYQSPNLIPVDGTLGGTMRFYRPRIWVLSKKWVLAEFEDGHIAGKILFTYSFSEKNNLVFKTIDYHLE